MSEVGPYMYFQIVMCVDKDDGAYHAYCPDLKGVHASGETEKEAIDNLVEAAGLHLECFIESGEPIPIGIMKQMRRQILRLCFEWLFKPKIRLASVPVARAA